MRLGEKEDHMNIRILGIPAKGSGLLLLGLLLTSCDSEPSVTIGAASQQPPLVQAVDSVVVADRLATKTSAEPGVDRHPSCSEEASVVLPIKIGEGQTQLKSGQAVTVRLWLVEGERLHETEPGSMQGDYLTGHFDLTAEDEAGAELARVRVNKAFQDEEMAFSERKQIPLLFADYNGDGAMDVSIGQPAGSNGSIYALFSLDSEGFRVLETDIYSADQRYSIRYPQAGTEVMVNTYYDQATGSYMEVRRTWENNAFVRSEPVPVAARPAGEDED
jgi:hypothetical protein